MSTAALEISGLSAGYHQGRRWLLGARPVPVLHEVSLLLEKGRTLALVGESGSGKSTLGKIVCGLHPFSSGTIHIAGQALDKRGRRWPLALRRRVQMVFQDALASLDARMRVGTLLEEPLVVHRIGSQQARRHHVAQLLHDVGLTAEYARRFPHQLSGGQRQRVGIARALALQPQLLVLDEPVSALDVSVQAQILNLLKDLQRERGLSYLFITHDMAVVEHMADEVAVMHSGRLVEQGARSQVLRHPQHPYTKNLLAAVPGDALSLALPNAPETHPPHPLQAAAAARLALYLSRQPLPEKSFSSIDFRCGIQPKHQRSYLPCIDCQ